MTNLTQYQTETDYKIRLRDRETGRGFTVSPEKDAAIHLLEDGLDGFDCTELLVETEPYANGTGGHPVRRRFGERYMTLTGELNPLFPVGELRRFIVSLLSPLRQLTMDVTLGSVTRQIDVIPWGKPAFRQSSFLSPAEVTLSFLAPDPFYRETTPRLVRFWQAVPLLTFPLNFWGEAGTTAGYFRTTDVASVVNPGDGACGFTAWLTAKGGTVTDPVLRCGDRCIHLLTTLLDGQTAQIDTTPRQKNLWIDGVRSFTFHRDSNFFLLDPGENLLRMEAASGLDFLEASLSYTPLYYGI